MRYETLMYIRDSSWILDKILGLSERKIKRNHSRNYFNTVRAANFSQNLHYAIFILFLGFIAVGSLFFYLEKDSGIRVINIRTSSMEPVINPASVIITSRENAYEIGDIITYRDVDPTTGVIYDRTYTHRIIDTKEKDGEKLFVTKGDANSAPDPYDVNSENILGKVKLIVPYLGYLVIALKTKIGFLVLVAIPAMLLIGNELNFIRDILVKTRK